ncbi:hypothetical protein GobsT_60490 [Gemmata obscuriglobus]|uniref:Uncharacterized protein n=1 Tax=Gemmata obscuriglobus TaxID=114 RepID=A0A2Z3GS67_9BACT|nr:hypothetical protein [Gemmata obscuriglobus]AWM36178.1 hypothetical protein C1280_03575 [Gemmata obscuriglobus]QEG31228.1 hypothetical protein GobsT_60490 [Gemmata obscuriglobus]VTS10566.1 unnamed protein product [Gemmata obscuriglobus UQM 2246]
MSETSPLRAGGWGVFNVQRAAFTSHTRREVAWAAPDFYDQFAPVTTSYDVVTGAATRLVPTQRTHPVSSWGVGFHLCERRW